MEYLVVGGGRVALNDRKARALLERVRWPEGPICPHCVVVGEHYRVRPQKNSRNPVREGVWKCRDCRKQFTVTVGTVFQGSKIPLSKWVTAIYLMSDPLKGVNAHQLHKRLGLTYKSARFMAGRIAESLSPGALGRKLNSLLEAEGVRLVRKRAKKGVRGAKKPSVAAGRKRKAPHSRGKGRSGGSGRPKRASRKAPARKR